MADGRTTPISTDEIVSFEAAVLADARAILVDRTGPDHPLTDLPQVMRVLSVDLANAYPSTQLVAVLQDQSHPLDSYEFVVPVWSHPGIPETAAPHHGRGNEIKDLIEEWVDSASFVLPIGRGEIHSFRIEGGRVYAVPTETHE